MRLKCRPFSYSFACLCAPWRLRGFASKEDASKAGNAPKNNEQPKLRSIEDATASIMDDDGRPVDFARDNSFSNGWRSWGQLILRVGMPGLARQAGLPRMPRRKRGNESRFPMTSRASSGCGSSRRAYRTDSLYDFPMRPGEIIHRPAHGQCGDFCNRQASNRNRLPYGNFMESPMTACREHRRYSIKRSPHRRPE